MAKRTGPPRKIPKPKPRPLVFTQHPQHVITEGIHGTWFYHYSDAGDRTISLCGERTMLTELPLSSWGFVGRLGERYCKSCRSLHLKSEAEEEA